MGVQIRLLCCPQTLIAGNAMRLRDAQIRSLDRPLKPYKLSDGGGLYLHVTPSGMYWRYRYRYGGKDKVLAIGVYPKVSLKEARLAHMSAKTALAEGIDPNDKKKRLKRQTDTPVMTFEAIAREWHGVMTPTWSNPKHVKQVINTLQTYVFPVLGAVPLDDITPPDVLAVLDKMQGKTETASRVKQRISAVFDYAIQTGRTARNPTQAMPKIGQGKAVKHHPALPEARISEFFTRLEGYHDRMIINALKLLLLTFVRPNELCRAEWHEINGDLWLIPAEKMKMRKAHTVPLSDWAQEILGNLRRLNRTRSPYIIHNANGGMINNDELPRVMRKLGYQGIAVPHGFRSMASSILNESGLWNVDAIERQLAHKDPDKVRSAYNRSDYMEERKKMMTWYSE